MPLGARTNPVRIHVPCQLKDLVPLPVASPEAATADGPGVGVPSRPTKPPRPSASKLGTAPFLRPGASPPRRSMPSTNSCASLSPKSSPELPPELAAPMRPAAPHSTLGHSASPLPRPGAPSASHLRPQASGFGLEPGPRPVHALEHVPINAPASALSPAATASPRAAFLCKAPTVPPPPVPGTTVASASVTSFPYPRRPTRAAAEGVVSMAGAAAVVTSVAAAAAVVTVESAIETAVEASDAGNRKVPTECCVAAVQETAVVAPAHSALVGGCSVTANAAAAPMATEAKSTTADARATAPASSMTTGLPFDPRFQRGTPKTP